MKNYAVLALEDGRTFVGRPLGADVPGEGEVVFNTAMTGYQEVLTDPSYAGQMLCMTYPLQGNYGVAAELAESGRVWARALIVRWACPEPSHHAAAAGLHRYLVEQGVPGISEIDTRALTRHIRTHGSLRAVLSHEAAEPGPERLAALVDRARQVTPIEAQDLVAETSVAALQEWTEGLPGELRPGPVANGRGLRVAVLDYGIKRNILRSLRQRGCEVLVLPHHFGIDEVLELRPDGLVLSNGPGDPARLEGPVALARAAIQLGLPTFGICLGHQIIGRAAGAETGRLPYGHHGANHPVKDLDTGQVNITSQNHEFQVRADTLPSEGDFYVSQVNLNDGTVEGLSHRRLPIFTVQYHPEGCPGPQDNQHLYDRFIDMVRKVREGRWEQGAPWRSASPPAPAAPRKVLIIGSGPIVIGQAAEFDYAGTQACKSLREEGIETVLVNSNPATIMTDEDVADRVYIEPLTVETVSRIIERERPDALLPTLGGQTGLNLAMELHQQGVLDRHGVRMIGASAETIRLAEDREAFKQLLIEIGEPVPPSRVCETLEAAREFALEIGLPVVIRPAYTLGGTGGGFARSPEELDQIATSGLAASPIHQILVERSLWGWKELEYEVMRDASGTCITVCNMENLDPMGVHTGDSIVVAPAQTLNDREHQMLRSAALRIIRALGIEGGCNVQFALDPVSSTYYVIEVNPRVSRSSALASKATGYPIARVAAKIAIGRRLEEIVNQVTGRTYAAFEPALDYCVVKIPRWPFDKFPDGDRRLGTQMASTGECMAIERTFEAAMMKAIRALEQRPPEPEELDDPGLVEVPNDRRLFALLHRLRRGEPVAELSARSSIDPWFLGRLAALVEVEARLAGGGGPDRVREARRHGFSDTQIGRLSGVAPEPSLPTYKLVDTCAAEFEASTAYYYSCWEEEAENPPPSGRGTLVIGSGPIRIGQGIEFDYCSVHAAWALHRAGRRAVMVNSNPETVSTDFDTSDGLYFEPLDADAVAQVARAEGIDQVVVQFGGQTAVNLAHPLEAMDLGVLGSSVASIDLAEDRRAFARVLERLGIPQPVGGTVALGSGLDAAGTAIDEAVAIAAQVGYPVLVRPSYVLGGRAMEIVHGEAELRRYMRWAIGALPRGTILVDKYLQGIEVEVDAIADRETVVIPGVMRHIERAGVHSGDSFAVYPAPGLEPEEERRIVEYTVRISREIGVRGLVNIQFVVHRGSVYVLEVNPRASRTVPILSKVTGVPMVQLATRVMLGERLAVHGYPTGLVPASELVAVKAPVFSMSKLRSVDSYLGPEMKSTGEVMGVDRELSAALHKAFQAAGMVLHRGAGVLMTVADADKPEILPVVSRLIQLGCTIHATAGTAAFLSAAGFSPEVVAKIGEPGTTVLDLIETGAVQLVINTMTGVGEPARLVAVGTGGAAPEEVRPPAAPVMRDGFEIRRAAVERRIPCLTSMDTAAALVESAFRAGGRLEVRTIDEWRYGHV